VCSSDLTLGKAPLIGRMQYEAFLNEGCANFEWPGPRYEWQAISLNYTMGTEGLPRGVLFHHRGAFLDAMSDVISSNMNHTSVYLWTLPMFRSNGWCNVWSVTAVAGTHICVRRKEKATAVFELIREHHVTHLQGVRGFVEFLAAEKGQPPLPHPVSLQVVDTNRHPQAVDKLEGLGFDVAFLYGLTETFGAAAVCRFAPSQAVEHGAGALMAHPAAHYPTLEQLQVVKPGTMDPLPADGQSEGEVVVRGNTVFKGYHKDAAGSARAFKGGVFRTGDLGKLHEDGSLEITRRARELLEHQATDMASVIARIEDVLLGHPSVEEAVVLPIFEEMHGKPESLMAYVQCKDYSTHPSEEILMHHCRTELGNGKMPDNIHVLESLPRTENGEICRYQLQQLTG